MTPRQADTSWILTDMGFPLEPGTIGSALHKIGGGVFLSVGGDGMVQAVRDTGRGMVPIGLAKVEPEPEREPEEQDLSFLDNPCAFQRGRRR